MSQRTAPLASTPPLSKPPWYKRRWAVAGAAAIAAAALLFSGVGIGMASADPKDTPEYQALAAELDTARGELQSTQGELSSTEAELDQITEDAEKAEAALDDRQTALDERAAALNERAAALRQAEKAVSKREKAVGIAEAEVAANTIPGDGVFQVGVDMNAGTYKTSGMTDCYYAVNADANANNIISNNITSGPAVVSVEDDQYFETSGCAEWVLQ